MKGRLGELSPRQIDDVKMIPVSIAYEAIQVPLIYNIASKTFLTQ